MSRSLDDPGLRAFLESELGEPLPEWPLRRWSVETLTLAALYFRPALEVARAQAKLAAAAIRSAGARPNPTLSIAPEFNSSTRSAVSPWLAAIHLDWPIETAGKRRHRIDRAEAPAAAARLAASGEAWRVRREIEAVTIDWDAAGRRLSSLRREVATAGRFARLLEERVARGAVSAAELAPIRSRLLESGVQLAAEEAASAILRARLAEVLGVPESACEAIEPFRAAAPSAPTLGTIQRDEALRLSLQQRADVLAALADYAASEAALELELARQVPDLHVGPGYGFDQGQNKWSVGISVDLPLLDQNQGPIGEAAAARAASAARFVATQASAIAAVERALAGREGARAQHQRVREREADLAANLRRVRAAVELGALDRAAELAAQLDQIRAQRAVVDADAGFQQALADLEAALGAPLAGSDRWIEGVPAPLGRSSGS
jgi:outer membrane protein TolC